ncbi:hypothetical protein COD22_06845 [Bacillus thuringiensis]|nr:hypothetical protein COD22_06845 [Bacillus thuringiensis]
MENRGSKLFETLIICFYELCLIAKLIFEKSKYSLQKATGACILYKQNRSLKKDFYFVTYNE